MKDEILLLDTHALIWWSIGYKGLSRRVRRLIEDDNVKIFVSAASAWEITTKARLGKLTWRETGSFENYCRGQGFDLLPVTFAHAERAGSWPHDHGDPFDRMLAAQASLEGLPIATSDPKIGAFGVTTVW
jgi:PIN domain nuclease of toxin-antitoxin system